MITFPQFESIVQHMEAYCEVVKKINKYDFWRTVTIDNGQSKWDITWFVNALSITDPFQAEIHLEGDIEIAVTGTWPNRTKMNLQVKSGLVNVAIPLTFYDTKRSTT